MARNSLHRNGVTNGRSGRFTPTHALNESQSVFVREYVANGGDRQKAARLAGYSDPRTEGYRLLNTPKIRKAIQEEQARFITCEGGSKGLAAMMTLLGEDTPHNVRFQAARWILEAAGCGVSSVNTNPPTPSLSEMTSEELEGFVRKSSAFLSQLAL